MNAMFLLPKLGGEKTQGKGVEKGEENWKYDDWIKEDLFTKFVWLKLVTNI